MPLFLILLVVLIILIARSGQQNKKKVFVNYIYPSMTNSEGLTGNTSVVDVTGAGFRLENTGASLVRYPGVIPHWGHRYIYSYNDIQYANPSQVAFYDVFKAAFLRGEYLDVEGNTNYFFILLFDLLNEFDKHNDLLLVEKQMTTLSTLYPRTRVYAIPFLIKRLEEKQMWTASVEVRGRHVQSNYGSYGFEGNYWGLGARYKNKLNLAEAETALLDNLYYSSNNFFEIEFCAIEILKLFLRTVSKLKDLYIAEGTEFGIVFQELADLVLRKHYHYQKNSWNYKSGQTTARNDIYLMILKNCENLLRDHYGHRRKLNIEFTTNAELKQQLEEKIFSKIEAFKTELLKDVSMPDEKTEVELYAQNTARWKIRFEQLTDEFSASDGKVFIEQIVALGELNRRNPSIEHIFYEASKFIAKKDKYAALNLYVRYLYHDLRSATFDNKPLTKTIQKSLFATPEQVQAFESVVSDLIQTKDLDKALNAISGFYTIKRKKIQLDKASIEDVHLKHAGTVDLLNEYLSDESENEMAAVSIRSTNIEEAVIAIKPKQDQDNSPSLFVPEIALTSDQVETLEKFAKASFVLSASDLESFAREKGLFKSGLVDGINEACYEFLDDVLIEEDNEDFVINPIYYQRILLV